MTFFKVGCVLLILFLTPLFVFDIDSAFAAEPTLVSKFPPATVAKIPGGSISSTLQINNVVIPSQPDQLLLVGISLGLEDTRPADTTVSSVVCGAQTLTLVAGANSTLADESSNVFFSLSSPLPTTCNVIITFSQDQGMVVPFTEFAHATAKAMLFSGVDQTTPIALPSPFITNTNSTGDGTPGNPPTGSNSYQSISGVTADHLVVDLISSIDTHSGVASDVGSNQNFVDKSKNSYFGFGYRMGISTQSGSANSDPMTWDLKVDGTYRTSAILIQSCDVTSSCTVAATFSSGSSGCSGDCTPPTLGIDEANNLIVLNGFAYNENPTNVELYYTSYPLITAYVGEENSISLKLYENSGPQDIAHVGVAFGLGEGTSFNSGRVVINWDRTFDGIETVSLIDPDNVLDNVRVESKEVDCESIDSQCLDIIFYHTFMAPLDFNMIGTSIWDVDRNGWQNYFNHGVEIIGDSLNPPKVYDGIHKGKIYQLTEIEKNKSVDGDGNTWTFEYGIWNKDYISVNKSDSTIINADKIWAMKHLLKDQYSDEIFGYDRSHNDFTSQKDFQILVAEEILKEMCLRCFDDSYDKIDNIFYYEISEKNPGLDSELSQRMNYESIKAGYFLQDMMDSYYPSRVFD